MDTCWIKKTYHFYSLTFNRTNFGLHQLHELFKYRAMHGLVLFLVIHFCSFYSGKFVWRPLCRMCGVPYVGSSTEGLSCWPLNVAVKFPRTQLSNFGLCDLLSDQLEWWVERGNSPDPHHNNKAFWVSFILTRKRQFTAVFANLTDTFCSQQDWAETVSDSRFRRFSRMVPDETLE